MSSAKLINVNLLKHYHDTMVEEVLTPAVTSVAEASASAYGHTISVSGSTLSLLDASGTTLSSITLPGGSVFVGSGSTAASGLVPAPSTTAGTTKYLREDGTWQEPPDTVYTHPTTAGNKHIPSGGSTGQILKYSSNGTATWSDPGYAASSHNHVGTEVTLTGYSKASSVSAVAATDTVNAAIGKLEKAIDGKQASGDYLTTSSSLDASKLTGTVPSGCYTNTTYSTFVKSGSTAASGLVPKPPTTAGTTKYLREDGSWQEPPNDNTVYTHPTTAGNKHIPSGGSTGQILVYGGSSGTASWTTPSYAASSHSHLGTEVTLTGYSKASSASAVAATDTVNAAIGKLEKAIDGKQASGSYLTSSSTLDASKLSGTVPSGCYTNTTYSTFVKSGSTAAAGLVPAPPTTAGTTKYLREDGSWQEPPNDNTVYTHPTTAGNKHIPSGGSTGQILVYGGSSGTASWTTPSYLTSSSTLDASKLSGTIPSGCYTNTTYSTFVKSGSSAATGLVPKPPTTAGTTKFLCEDASWAVPPGTYTHPTTAGNKHVPSGGSSGQILKYSAAGTAAWADVSSLATFVKSGSTAAAGLVPAPSTTAGTTKYLREDGTWQVPPDNNTTYSNMTAATTNAGGAAGLVPASSALSASTDVVVLTSKGTWEKLEPITDSEIDALFA